jgi:TatD DNase family protein
MEFWDTHCHIQSAGSSAGERTTGELWAKAPDLNGGDIIKNAQAVGVNKLVCVGCDLADSKLAVEFAQAHPNCVASIGIHPHEAQHFADDNKKLEEFANLAKAGKAVAIGECGLDYFYTHSPKEAQIAILKFQIELAKKYDLPMIFHVREAFDDFWPVFEASGGKMRGVLHSFTDSVENLHKATAHNLYIGVNGIATFAKDEEKRVMYRTVPLERLLLETDSPFLTPVPYRGTINEPKHIREVAEYLSQIRGESIEEIARVTTKNARDLFARA